MVRAADDTRDRLRWQTLEEEPALPGLGEADRVTYPEFRDIEFLHVRAKSILNHVPSAAGMPFEWTINPYRGCTHACTYCFARPTHAYLDLGTGRDFDTRIVVKVNAVERLRAELRSPRWGGHHIALGTNTDPYQRAEGRYRLTRGIVRTLTDAGNPYSVLTKGTLVTRDLDVFTAAGPHRCTAVNLSIPTMDEDVWRLTEPGTPSPARRMDTVAELNQAGVPSGVMMGPIIPGLSDSREQLAQVVVAAVAADATFITPITLHLRPGVREVFLASLREVRPDLAERLEAMYPRTYAAKAVRERIGRTVADLVERHASLAHPMRGPRVGRGGRRIEQRANTAAPSASATAGEQLSLC